MISKKTLVVILNYNHYKNTKQCVESLISSNDIGNDFLIVIVDNCSKNESFEIWQIAINNLNKFNDAD